MKCHQITTDEQVVHTAELQLHDKKLSIHQRFHNHPKNKSKARKVDREINTIIGRLVLELERNFPSCSKYQSDIALFKKY
jgi:IS5 family transposase